ncbi:hypothetical protein COLO4_06610 [Corchorus olitorius]|uniref:Uncharacterized protein n=1 Tax=Corchorus olitorius TaxID=93759 RepID=A0A1R3KMK8_9ROSI|nr:hypothetical protein COLO4_06610 [Corchorus olitorius]
MGGKNVREEKEETGRDSKNSSGVKPQNDSKSDRMKQAARPPQETGKLISTGFS